MREARCAVWRVPLHAGLTLLALCALTPSVRAATANAAEPNARAPSSRIGISTGFDYSAGDYGESQTTEVWYVPFTIKYEWRSRWILRATIPYLRVTSPGSIVSGADVVAASDTGPRETREGLGDVVIGITYRLDPPRRGLPWIDLTAKVKAPTASQKQGLGTGEVDTTLQIDLMRPIGRLTPFATVAYRFVGDPPDADLTDTLSASVGFDWRIASMLSAGAYYGWRQTASRSLGDAHEIVSFASWKLGGGFSIGPYAQVGLSTAAPDFGAGVSLGYKH